MSKPVLKQSGERLYYIDNLRGIASIMGVFYHVGLIFSSPWIINVDSDSYLRSTQLFINYLNIARMPVFLIISGFFAMYSLEKYKTNIFLVKRLQRIMLPLLSGIIIIIPIQHFLINYSDASHLSLLYLGHTLKGIYLETNLSHLWFLYHILLFSVILLFLYSIDSKWKVKAIQLFHYCNKTLIRSILFWSFLCYSLHFAGKVAVEALNIPASNDLFKFDKLGINFPVFLFGAFVNKYSKLFRENLLNGTDNTLLLLFSVYTLCSLFLSQDSVELGKLLWPVIQVLKISLTLLILNLIYRYMNFTNPLLKFISNASFAFYIIHHPVVIGLGILYLHVGGSKFLFLDYILLCIVSILITYAIYFILIEKNKIGKWLLLGDFNIPNKQRLQKAFPLFFRVGQRVNNLKLRFN